MQCRRNYIRRWKNWSRIIFAKDWYCSNSIENNEINSRMVVIWVEYSHFYNKNNFGKANAKYVLGELIIVLEGATIVFIKRNYFKLRKKSYYRVWPLITQNKSRCTSKNMTNQIPNNNRLLAKNLWKNIVVVLFSVIIW